MEEERRGGVKNDVVDAGENIGKNNLTVSNGEGENIQFTVIFFPLFSPLLNSKLKMKNTKKKKKKNHIKPNKRIVNLLKYSIELPC